MSPANTGKEESQRPSSHKPSSAGQEAAVKCPRCDSPNTKFCYYNNYSLTQPRHFCKTCRRYWTKGGALRNVPIGGGCRKNKKTKSPSGDSKASAASSDVGGFKFFQGLSPPVDFQPQIHSSNTNFLFTQFPSFGGLSNASAAISHATSCFNLDPSLMAFGLPLSSSSLKQGQEMGSASVHANLASSIQSLSSINQDLHWKLQQQRLATLFVEDDRKETSGNIEKPQPIQFHNLEKPMADSYPIKDNNFSSAEWGFSNSYAPLAPIPATSSSNHLNGNSANWGTGIQAWSEMNQYNSLA